MVKLMLYCKDTDVDVYKDKVFKVQPMRFNIITKQKNGCAADVIDRGRVACPCACRDHMAREQTRVISRWHHKFEVAISRLK